MEIANDLKDIFRELYDASYPIEKIKLIDEYNASDDASIRDNNSSCFNYRTISGTNVISKHGMGLAMDINTFYNPYVTWYNGVTKVEPSNATAYVDRSKDFIYKINRNDLCYRLFIQHGFEWGGDWSHAKDYQHFELPNSRVNAIKARQGV